MKTSMKRKMNNSRWVAGIGGMTNRSRISVPKAVSMRNTNAAISAQGNGQYAGSPC